MIDIKAIKKRLYAITPGKRKLMKHCGMLEIKSELSGMVICDHIKHEDDAHFFLHAPTDIAALLDAYEGEKTVRLLLEEKINADIETAIEVRRDRNRWKTRAEALERIMVCGKKKPLL